MHKNKFFVVDVFDVQGKLLPVSEIEKYEWYPQLASRMNYIWFHWHKPIP